MSRATLKPVISRLREIIIKDIVGKMEKYGFDFEGNIRVNKPISEHDEIIKSNIISLFKGKKISGNKKEYSKYIQDSARTFLHIIICFKTMEKRELIGKIIENLMDGEHYTSIIPNFINVSPLAYSELINRHVEAIDYLEHKDGYKEDREYYNFIYVLDLLSKEMAKEVPLLFKDYEHTLVLPDFDALKEILFAIDNIEYKEYLEDDFLGWIYQYWVDVKDEELKFAQKNASIGYKETLYFEILKELEAEQTQFGEFYTPRWVVKYIVDNTLKPYFEENKKIDEIKLLDPACGAGNFLVYSFDVFYELYKKEYPEMNDRKIITSILENNIFGVDIQREPLQITALNLWFKAKKKALDIKIVDLNLFNMNILKANSLYRYENDGEENIQLNFFESVMELTEKKYTAEDIGKYISAQERIAKRDAKVFFSNKFNVIVMNPPYLDINNMNIELNEYLTNNYLKYHKNLFSAFIKRGYELLDKNGIVGIVSTDTFLTRSYFELRKLILSESEIKRIIHLGFDVFDGVNPSSVILIASKHKVKEKIEVYDIKKYKKSNIYDLEVFFIEESINGMELSNNHFNLFPQKEFYYNVNDRIKKIIRSKYKVSDKLFHVKTGMRIGNNNKYLLYNWEVPTNLIDEKYYFYAKGGGAKKWVMDYNWVVDWSSEANNFYKINGSHRNPEFYFKEGLNFSDISGTQFTARILPKNHIFDAKGPSIFSFESEDRLFVLGLVNSKLFNYLLNIFNPKGEFKIGDVSNLPYRNFTKEDKKTISNLVKEIINLKKITLSYNYISRYYDKSEIEQFSNDERNIFESVMSYKNYIEKLNNKIYLNESCIDNLVYRTYEIIVLDQKIIEEEFGKSSYDYEVLENPKLALNSDEFKQLYILGEPNKTGKKQKPLNIIEIAEFKKMNPDDVLKLRKEYRIHREKDMKIAILNWIRAIVKDTIIKNESKLYLDTEIEVIIKKYIEENFENGYLIIEEMEDILGKDILGVIRGGVKIGSSNTTFAGKGSKDLSEPLLQQKVLAGTGVNKIVIIWHLTQFLLEFEENKKYVMQRNIGEISEVFNQRLIRVKEQLQATIKSTEKKALAKQEKILMATIKTLSVWKVL